MNARERLAMARSEVAPNPVTSALAAWDGKYTDAAIKTVMEVMAHDLKYDRKDGSGRLRPSSLKHPCDRVKLFSYHGEVSEDDNPDMRRIADLGTIGHYWWQLAGLSAGVFDAVELKFSYEPWLTAGSADGRLSSNLPKQYRGLPFELKTMTWQKFKESAGRRSLDGLPAPVLLDEHLPQLYALMASFGTRQVVVIYQERNTARFHEFLYKWDDEVAATIDRMMSRLVNHVESGTFPAMLHGCVLQRGNVYAECGFKEPCFREG